MLRSSGLRGLMSVSERASCEGLWVGVGKRSWGGGAGRLWCWPPVGRAGPLGDGLPALSLFCSFRGAVGCLLSESRLGRSAGPRLLAVVCVWGGGEAGVGMAGVSPSPPLMCPCPVFPSPLPCRPFGPARDQCVYCIRAAGFPKCFSMTCLFVLFVCFFLFTTSSTL